MTPEEATAVVTEEGAPDQGRSLIIGQQVSVAWPVGAEPRVGEVDRVTSSGDLYVWFGVVDISDARVCEVFPCTVCSLV